MTLHETSQAPGADDIGRHLRPQVAISLTRRADVGENYVEDVEVDLAAAGDSRWWQNQSFLENLAAYPEARRGRAANVDVVGHVGQVAQAPPVHVDGRNHRDVI